MNSRMGHDRIASSFSFSMTLIVFWAAATIVSSFQAATTFTSFQHSFTKLSSGELRICNGKQNRQQHFLQSSVEASVISDNNAFWNIEDKQEFGLQYLSSNRQRYGSKTIDKAYQRQSQKWADRYTSVEALRETFGTNRNKVWGDLEAGTARRLYKTLLPRALLELSRVGAMPPEDLAPLAYQARVAAKLYTRERCTMPARLGATLYDGFRNWRTYGRFQAHGLTYEQIWEKYANAIVDEVDENFDRSAERDSNQEVKNASGEDEVNVKVCQKILERACKTNEGVDTLVLTSVPERHQNEFLENIHHQLQRDVYDLLLPLKSAANRPLASLRQFRTLRWMVRAKQQFSKKQQQS